MILIDSTIISKSNENLKNKINLNYFSPKESIDFLYYNLKRLIFSTTFISAMLVFLFVFLMGSKKSLFNGEINKYNYYYETRVNTLTQFWMDLSQNHYSASGKTIFDYSFFTKAKYDIYTLNESLVKKGNNSYFTIFTTAIIINSICFEFNENKTNCQLRTYLDLTIKNKNNLQINKNIFKEIKEVILPLCLIEHSIDNNIISVTCPETLPENLKNNIINAFQSIRPNLSKEKLKNPIIDDKGDNAYIIINEKCRNNNESGQICESIEKIYIDGNGNLKRNIKDYKYGYIKDDNNIFYNNYNYSFEEIINKNDTILIENNFKYNLKILLELINPLMIKEKFIKNNRMNRKLEDKNVEYFGLREESFFAQSLFGINISLNIKNDLGLGYMENTKLISNFIRGSNNIALYHNEISTKINETLNKFVILSKTGNKLANLLYQNLNKFFSLLPDKISSYINDLSNLLYFKDLSSIFDSVSAIDSLKSLPFSIFSASNSLYKNITKLNDNIENSLIDVINKLKDDIIKCLDESKNLTLAIINNLTELNNILSSNNGKITLISKYYLNEQDIWLRDLIYQTKEIIDNYNAYEKYQIDKLINTLLMDFSIKFVDSMRVIQSLLDKIVNNIQSKKLSIESGNINDIENLKNNLVNTKEKLYDLMPNIESILKKEIETFLKGYFKTKVNFNFDEIYNKSIQTNNIIENKLFIDSTFDIIMSNFKNNFMNLLLYIEKTKKEKFPLKNTILGNTYFIKMEQDFGDEKVKIVNYIKEENNQYLYSVHNLKESFIINNKSSLDNIFNIIDNQLSDINLYNLNVKYNETMTTILYSISAIVENNKNLAVEYLTNVANSGSCYCTQAFINKGTAFKNSFTEIKNFIQLNLKNNLSNRYLKITDLKNVFLHNIEINPIIHKYLNYLPFFEDYIRFIEIITTRFDKYFSSFLYNQNYNSKIDFFITEIINNITEIENTINYLYNSVGSLSYSSDSTNDYYKYWQNCEKYCSKKKFGICTKHSTRCYDHYDPYTVTGTYNHLNIKSFKFSEFSEDFDSQINAIYTSISTNVTQFNGSLLLFHNNMNSIKNQILNKQTNYLDNISQKINYFIDDKLCNNYTILVYEYFKNELQSRLIVELNDILNSFKKLYNEVNEKINLNSNKFIYSIEELGLLGQQYYKLYYHNISYDYIDSIFEQRKNDLNYTIKYYFNMLLSKVNKTYSYILNNLPINQEIFNDILNKRNNELRESYNNIINQIYTTKNRYINIQKQFSIINVSQNDFFNINSNIGSHYDIIKSEITLKNNELLNSINKNKKEYSIESLVSKLYLENILSEQQMKVIYEPVNRDTFIDLHTDLFENLIKDILKIDQNELIKQIKNYLIKNNNVINQNFENEKTKYENILQDKIYNEFLTKDNLENKINNIYSNGLKKLDANSKSSVYNYLKEILNKIKSYITSEVNRLNNELTSYSSNYNLIQNRLNNLKSIIFNQFYTSIISISDEFYSKIISKFYTNYIENNLESLLNNAKAEKYEESKFLNISIVLKNIIIEIINKLIKEYKYLAMTHINYLNQKNYQELDELFSFSTLKSTIDSEIDNLYKSQLLPALKEKAIYKSGDKDVSDYDLSSSIVSNITSFIDSKIKEVQAIINKMKNDKFNIEENWKIPDFSFVNLQEFVIIKNSFEDFYKYNHDKELEEIEEIITESIKNNYKMIIENFIPSFGKDFFERIFKYNEIQNTKSIFNCLKYSFNQTLNYYSELISFNKSIIIPEDLKNKILTINDINSLVISKNEEIITKLNKKFDRITQETKGYFVDNFINYLKTDIYIQYALEDNIKTILNKILDNNSNYLENEYINIINIYIKNSFINQYKNMIIAESNDMIKYIDENKNIIKKNLDSLNTFKTDIIYSNIEKKSNDIIDSIENYYYMDSFEISKETKILLNNYTKKNVLPCYEEIKYILDDCTKDIVLENMNDKIKGMKNIFLYSVFDNKALDIKNKLRNLYFNNMTNYLNHSYGTIESEYLEYLNKELLNFEKLRRLGIDENEEEQKFPDQKLDESFKLLKKSVLGNIEFIQTLYLFYTFDEKINEYINEINEQYINTKDNIKNRNYDNNITQYLNTTLDDLKNYIINYYNKVNSSFHQTKDFIENSINQIYELIEKSADITFKVFNDKYYEIKNDFNPIKYKIIKEIPIEVDKHIEKDNDVNYIIEAEIDKFVIENEISLDFIYENGNTTIPKIIGKIINKNHPNRMVIDFYTNYGYICEIKGKRMVINFNNVSMISDFIFDSSLNRIMINNSIDFDEYNIRNEKYSVIEKNFRKVMGGITFIIPNLCVSTLDGEVEVEIVSAKKNKIYEKFEYL